MLWDDVQLQARGVEAPGFLQSGKDVKHTCFSTQMDECLQAVLQWLCQRPAVVFQFLKHVVQRIIHDVFPQ